MPNNCPSCNAPITDDARFCSHCGAKLPDNTQKLEIESHNITEVKYEDTAKLEEVRLKYQLEERKRQEKNESNQKGSKSLKIKRWVSWLVCIAFLCAAMLFHDSNENLSTVLGILFFASGIYAIIISVVSLFRKRH